MMARRLGEETRAVLDRAARGIDRAEIEAADAGKGDGSRAHGARLERPIEVATGEPLAAEFGARAARVARGAGGAVGSGRGSVGLPGRASTSPSALTTTAPIGTSPRSRASSASASARSMGGPALPLTPSSASFGLMGGKVGVKRGQGQAPRTGKDKAPAAKAESMRIAKAIAPAGLCSRRD